MKSLKAGDYIIVFFILLAGVLVSYLSYGNHGEYIVIRSGNKVYGEYSLRQNKNITVESKYGWNKIVISNGKAWVTDASCKDKLDVSQGKISKAGQSIICLPNRLIVTVKGGASFDALSY